MSSVLSNLLIIESTAGREAEMEKHLTTFVLLARQADGCLSYDCFQSLETTTRFMMQIRWRDRESLDRHLGSAELRHFLESGSALLAESFAAAYRNFLPEEAD